MIAPGGAHRCAPLADATGTTRIALLRQRYPQQR